MAVPISIVLQEVRVLDDELNIKVSHAATARYARDIVLFRATATVHSICLAEALCRQAGLISTVPDVFIKSAHAGAGLGQGASVRSTNLKTQRNLKPKDALQFPSEEHKSGSCSVFKSVPILETRHSKLPEEPGLTSTA